MTNRISSFQNISGVSSQSIVARKEFCRTAINFLARKFTQQDVLGLFNYATSNHELWTTNCEIKMERPLLIKAKEAGIVRDLKVVRKQNGEIEIYVVFNKIKKRDRLVGAGKVKVVKQAMELSTGRMWARLSLPKVVGKDLQFASNEFEISKFANQVDGLVGTLTNTFLFYTNKHGVEKASFLQQLYSNELFVCIERVMQCDFLKAEEQVTLFRTLLKAVSGLHKMGIIHRDLKPENVLVNMNATNKIVKVAVADLGLYCYMNSSLSKYPEGTTAYLSPEYASACIEEEEGEKIASSTTPKHDAWAVGIILLLATYCNQGWMSSDDEDPPSPYWLFGFNREQQLTTIAGLEEGWLPQPKNRRSIEHIIWQMLRVNPLDRIDCAEALELLDTLLYPK